MRDRTKEAISANTTASAMGANRKPEMPGRKNIGTKTMQMHSSETKAGATICCAPSRMALLDVLALFQVPVDVLDGDGRVVHQNAHRQRQARPAS